MAQRWLVAGLLPRRPLVASRLLGLRVRNPPGGLMFVLCVVSKDKKANAGQSRQRHKYG